MAELYLAKDTRSDRMVVLKRILPYLAEEDDFVHMFLDEARIAASLHHANVVEVIELGRLEGSTFIAMEWVNGIDLRRVLQIERERSGVVPPGIAAWIVARLCEGLHYAHMRTAPDGTPLGIIHRDVSPQNVMLSFRGDVKLVDFGISKATAWMTRSKPGIIKGKFLYLAPEQVSQDRADSRADLFSVGVLLYELTTGKSPFFRPTSEEVIYAIRMEEAEAPLHQRPGFPVALSRIIMKCLQKDRTKRYQTGEEVRAALEDFMRVDLPTTRADVARYLSTLFGDEEERTSIFIPPNAQSPMAVSISGSSPSITEPTRTEPMRTEARSSEPAERTEPERTAPMRTAAGTALLTSHQTADGDDATVDMEYPAVEHTAPLSAPRPPAHLGDDDADIPPTAVSVSGARNLRVGEILPSLLPERFELDDLETKVDDGRPPPLPPPLPSLPEVSAYSVGAPTKADRPEVAPEEGFVPPARPPPLPRKPARQPPIRQANKPPPPIARAPVPAAPPRRKLPPPDPDDFISTVESAEKDVKRRIKQPPRRPAPPAPDRRGQYVLMGIIGVSFVVVLILLVMVLWPKSPKPSPVRAPEVVEPVAPRSPVEPTTKPTVSKVKVSIRGPRISKVTVDGTPVVESFEHLPGPAVVVWLCPPKKRGAKSVEHSHIFEVPAAGPVLFDLSCP